MEPHRGQESVRMAQDGFNAAQDGFDEAQIGERRPRAHIVRQVTKRIIR